MELAIYIVHPRGFGSRFSGQPQSTTVLPFTGMKLCYLQYVMLQLFLFYFSIILLEWLAKPCGWQERSTWNHVWRTKECSILLIVCKRKKLLINFWRFLISVFLIALRTYYSVLAFILFVFLIIIVFIIKCNICYDKLSFNYTHIVSGYVQRACT